MIKNVSKACSQIHFDKHNEFDFDLKQLYDFYLFMLFLKLFRKVIKCVFRKKYLAILNPFTNLKFLKLKKKQYI